MVHGISGPIETSFSEPPVAKKSSPVVLLFGGRCCLVPVCATSYSTGHLAQAPSPKPLNPKPEKPQLVLLGVRGRRRSGLALQNPGQHNSWALGGLGLWPKTLNPGCVFRCCLLLFAATLLHELINMLASKTLSCAMLSMFQRLLFLVSARPRRDCALLHRVFCLFTNWQQTPRKTGETLQEQESCDDAALRPHTLP